MHPDETSAAYGLFTITYAYLGQQLAGAVFYLRRRNEPKLQFPQVMKRSAEQLIDALLAELGEIETTAFGREVEREIDALRRICSEFRAVKDWRDQRIHARVQIDDSGIALFDWRTRKQLPMTAEECYEFRKRAIALAVGLDMHVGRMLDEAEIRAKIDELISTALEQTPDEQTLN